MVVIPMNAGLAGPNPFLIHQIDPVPEADGHGRRKYDGWRVQWEAMVEKSRATIFVLALNPVGWSNPGMTLHGAAAAWLVDT